MDFLMLTILNSFVDVSSLIMLLSPFFLFNLEPELSVPLRIILQLCCIEFHDLMLWEGVSAEVSIVSVSYLFDLLMIGMDSFLKLYP